MSRGWGSTTTFAALAIAVAALAYSARVTAQTPTVRVDFSFQIRPLLSDRCFRCHGPDASKRKAKLRLDTREGVFKDIGDGWAVVKPGDPASSELVRRTSTDFEDDVMPPADSHLSLSEPEKALLRRWVLEGAEYKPHWSLIPVQPSPSPRARRGLREPIPSTRSYALASRRCRCRLRNRQRLRRSCVDWRST